MTIYIGSNLQPAKRGDARPGMLFPIFLCAYVYGTTYYGRSKDFSTNQEAHTRENTTKNRRKTKDNRQNKKPHRSFVSTNKKSHSTKKIRNARKTHTTPASYTDKTHTHADLYCVRFGSENSFRFKSDIPEHVPFTTLFYSYVL